MDYNTAVKHFNKTLKNLLKELKKNYPDVTEFSKSYDLFVVLKKVNPGKAHRIFLKNLEQYELHIINREDHFFLERQYALKQSNIFDFDSLISLIKNIWTNSTAESKNALWEHITLLLALAKQCRQMCPENMKNKYLVNATAS